MSCGEQIPFKKFTKYLLIEEISFILGHFWRYRIEWIKDYAGWICLLCKITSEQDQESPHRMLI